MYWNGPFEIGTIWIPNFKMFGIGMVFGIPSSEFEPPLYSWSTKRFCRSHFQHFGAQVLALRPSLFPIYNFTFLFRMRSGRCWWSTRLRSWRSWTRATLKSSRNGSFNLSQESRSAKNDDSLSWFIVGHVTENILNMDCGVEKSHVSENCNFKVATWES